MISDREATRRRAENAVATISTRLNAALRPRGRWGSEDLLKEFFEPAVAGVQRKLIESYAKLDGAGELPLSDELVKEISDRVVAFIDSTVAGFRGNAVTTVKRLAADLEAVVRATVPTEFENAVYDVYKRKSMKPPSQLSSLKTNTASYLQLLNSAYTELKQYEASGDPTLRSSITKKLPMLRKIVQDLKTGKVLTVVPPAMIGGPVMRIDPLANPFGTGYGENHIGYTLGIIEESIGALEHGLYPASAADSPPADDLTEKQATNHHTKGEAMGALFISHASNDKPLVEAFVDLLESGVGVPHKQIFCSSLKGQNVKPGSDFVDSIHTQLGDAKGVVALLSESFHASAFCMCELGGVWLASSKLLPVIVPPLGYNVMKGVLGNLQASKLGDDADLDELRDVVIDLLGIEGYDTPRWNSKKQIFLANLDSLVKASPYKGPVSREEHEKTVKELEEYKTSYAKMEQEFEGAKRQIESLKKA